MVCVIIFLLHYALLKCHHHIPSYPCLHLNADMPKNTTAASKFMCCFFLIPAEKPSLQSRHSLDSSRVQDKEAGPLWITLALQKQKGFREQQQSRDDRRSLREAKLAEKQSRDRESVIILNDLSDSPTWLLHVFCGTPSRPVP